MTSVGTRKNTTLASLLRTETLSTPKPAMESEKNDSCRSQSLILNKVSKPPTSSYFLSINFPISKKPSSKPAAFTKVRIKIPRLLVKTVKKPSKKKEKRRNNATVHKLASMLSKPFVSKKNVDVSDIKLEKTFACDLKEGCVKNVEEFGSKSASEYTDSYSTGSPYSSSSRDHLFEIPLFSGKCEIQKECAGKDGVCPTCKRPWEPESSTRSILTKVKSGMVIKDKNSASGWSSCSNSSSTNVVSSLKTLTDGKVEKEIDEEHGDKELCKKKIIMGRKNKVSSHYFVM